VGRGELQPAYDLRRRTQSYLMEHRHASLPSNGRLNKVLQSHTPEKLVAHAARDRIGGPRTLVCWVDVDQQGASAE
jgi:hypothetical protein